MWVEDARYADGLLVNGRPPTDILRPRPLRFVLAAGGRRVLRFHVPGTVIERALGAGSLRLRLAVTTADEPFALLGRYRVTARPHRPRG